MNAIPAAKQIFDSLIHSYQLYTIAISSNLKKFFNKNNQSHFGIVPEVISGLHTYWLTRSQSIIK